jgi:hypothetical protein
MYVAVINTPGYLPEAEPAEFDTARQAWLFLATERQREEDERWDSLPEDEQWAQVFAFSPALQDLRHNVERAAWDVMAMEGWDGTGSVTHGDLAYEVMEVTV